MTDKDLDKKRKDFKEEEDQQKIINLSAGEAFRQQTLKEHYTTKQVRIVFGKFGWTLIIGQATFILFFSSLFICSFIPKTKFLVSKFLP